jgi:hypothetical protein
MRLLVALALTLVATLTTGATAFAGCGCDKPPPPPAPVRPNAAYPGAPITFFGNGLDDGVAYTVTFVSGITGEAQSVIGIAVRRRDLADRAVKTQLEVALPALPLGPTAITVTALGATAPVVTVVDRDFTTVGAPLPVPNVLGNWELPGAQAAVSRDGIVYLALDLTDMRDPMVVTAQALGFPLRFDESDVVFYNRQGFLMQRLVTPAANATVPVPGMFVVPSDTFATDSDELHYSRHEFATYFLQHQERQPHAVDPTDGNWHLDGSPHIDHDHLIMAIAGHLNDGSLPPAGATPVFDLKLATYSLFHTGITASGTADISATSIVDSYDSDTMLRGSDAVVSSLTAAKVRDAALVRGDVVAPTVTFEKQGIATGVVAAPTSVGTLMGIKVPAGIPNLGDVDVKSGVYTITGPGSIQVKKFKVSNGARIFVDNAAGPVTIYATDEVNVADTSSIDLADPRPERFAIYATSGKPVQFTGKSRTAAAVYAPNAPITVGGDADFSGALVGKSLLAKDRSRIHYDSTLRGKDPVTSCLQATIKAPVAGKPFDAKVQCVNGLKTTVGFLVTAADSYTGNCVLVASDPKTLKPMSSLSFNVKVQCDSADVPFTLTVAGVS